MVLRRTAVSVISFFLALTVFGAENEAQIGSIASLKGQARLTTAAGAVSEAKRGMPLHLKSKIETAAASTAQHKLKDGTMLTQGEKSLLVLDEYLFDAGDKARSGAAFSLLKGTLSVVTGKITKLNPDRFRVTTRLAALGVRGCSFVVVDRPDGVVVYALQFAKGEKIVAEGNKIAAVAEADRTLDKAGVKLTIDNNGKVTKEEFKEDELAGITNGFGDNEWSVVRGRYGLSVGHKFDRGGGVYRFRAVNVGPAAHWRLKRFRSDEAIDFGVIPAGKSVGGYNASNDKYVTSSRGTWIKEIKRGDKWIGHGGTSSTQ